MSARNLAIVISVTAAVALTSAGAAWMVWPAPSESPSLVASLDPVAGVGDKKKGRRKSAQKGTAKARKAEGRPKDPARARKEKPVKAPMLEGEERAQARTEFRDERLLDANDRLDAHAEKAGWDPETTETIRELLIDTADHVTTTLASVDQGSAEWEKVKAELRDYRLQQADTVRGLLGDAGFEAFVKDMGFERFFGEEPVRGRVK